MRKLLFIGLMSVAFALQAQQPSMQWADQIGGGFPNHTTDIAVDSLGNVYSIGFFRGTVDFDPGPGTSYHTSAGDSVFDSDIYITKINTLGGLVWSRSIGNGSSEDVNGIALDRHGNVYITGGFSGLMDFDPGTGVTTLLSQNIPTGGHDIFILKLDTNGDFVWVKGMGGNSADNGNSITVDDEGNVYTVGDFANYAFLNKRDADGNQLWTNTWFSNSNMEAMIVKMDVNGDVLVASNFEGTADMDPSSNTFNLISTGGRDIAISRFSSSGGFLWAKKLGGGGAEYVYDMALDKGGNIFVTGTFSGTADFNPGTSVNNLVALGNFDRFACKLNADGEYIWANATGSTNYDWSYNLALDTLSNLYMVGSFPDGFVSDIDPGPGVFNLVSYGVNDGYVQKLDSAGNFIWARRIGSTGLDEARCVAVDPRFGNIYVSGAFRDSLLLADDWGQPGMFAPDPPLGGDNFDVYLIKLNQCDADSITLPVTACKSYTINGHTYTASGTYTEILTMLAGCDSVITLNLTINTVDTAVTQAGAVLTATLPGASYQWINCAGNTPITGATSQSYTAPANGQYAVVITTNNCSDTSRCLNVTGLGIAEGQAVEGMTLYPNPVVDYLTLELDKDVRVQISDLQGKKMYSGELRKGVQRIDMSRFADGIYLLSVSDAGGGYTRSGKLVKRSN